MTDDRPDQPHDLEPIDLEPIDLHQPGPPTYTEVAHAPAWKPAPRVQPARVQPARHQRSGRAGAKIAGLVAIALGAGAIGFAIEASTNSTETTIGAGGPAITIPGTAGVNPTAADRTALADLVVQQTDVSAPHVVVLIPNGNRTTEPTLDLCNGTFPSEQLRAARLQVAELDPDTDPNGDVVLSTEAVTYKRAANGAQAFTELRRVRETCPDEPVPSPVGGGTAQTSFKAPPDGTWAKTPTVERLAYSFTTTAGGETSPSIAVYLRRGRVLMGLYFPQPNGAQPAVEGKTSVEDIVGLFEARIADVPASVATP